MGVADFLLYNLTVTQYLELILRIVVAGICGAGIGYERSIRYKEAGIRTHIIVCVASALIMIISRFAFVAGDISMYGITFSADSARMAAQVVSGISFLCAGVIFKNGNTIKGLTTAAGIFATAGIGLSLGAGMYILGIIVTVLLMGMQIAMHHFLFGPDAMITQRIKIVAVSSMETRKLIYEYFENFGIKIVEHNVEVEEDRATISLIVMAPSEIDVDEFTYFLRDRASIISVSVGNVI
ncbi:MAG: MgtC/SapB family protein [Lachnospiraceae bacterium]|nr:MgtC/SapB family protein [Lachnospiraceae bacterium]